MSKKISNSRNRLIELMQYYNINQTELCNRSGLQKSALSNYLNGDREPRQNQIALIADAFNVNPAWLMGYDTPMEMPEFNLNMDFDTSQISKAVEMFKTYEIATPEIKAAIDSLLKTVKPIADESRKIASQMNIPHLEVPKSSAELPYLKKDKK